MNKFRVLFLAALSCVTEAAQPAAPSPIAAPLRELPWAQLNFLHTTDTHGWLGGHLQEPSYSADWGDYISFAQHLRAKADKEGVDILLVDTGDRVEGNGLFDASVPKGKYLYDIFKEQEIEIITSGNHELYKQNSSNNEFYYTVPNFKDGYLASNLDIYNPETGDLEPLARRFKKFTTKNQGIRILAFGFIFNFHDNNNHTVITTVEDTIKKDWFQEAIRDKEIDLIIVTGHVGIRSTEYQHLYKAIRSVNWDIPIQFFAGHLHIRDYQIYDNKAVSIESGRYMETIGFMSIDGLSVGGKGAEKTIGPVAKGLKFSRRYIDNNLFSLYHHSGKNESTFSTPHGINVTNAIATARTSLGLDKRHGCAPQDYWLNRAPYPRSDSLLSLLTDQILPDQIRDPGRKNVPSLVIVNSGGLRFDILKGPFTRDSDYLVMPFTGGFKYVKDLPYKSARRVLSLLNNEGPVLETVREQHGLSGAALAPLEQLGRATQKLRRNASPSYLTEHSPRMQAQQPLKDSAQDKLLPGYTTHDDAGSDGDDTLHSQIQFFDVPNCVQATLNFASSVDEPEIVDLVFNDFVQPYLLLALQYLGEKVTEADTFPYMEGTSFTDVIPNWVEQHWGDCGA